MELRFDLFEAQDEEVYISGAAAFFGAQEGTPESACTNAFIGLTEKRIHCPQSHSPVLPKENRGTKPGVAFQYFPEGLLYAAIWNFDWDPAVGFDMGRSATLPKVEFTTTTPTLKSLVAAVNCLSANPDQGSAAKGSTPAKGSLQAETFQIVGPQHSHPYSAFVMAVLTVPTGGTLKSAVVTPDNREATVTAEAGGSCTVKFNADKTVDSHCYIAGGTVYVLYR